MNTIVIDLKKCIKCEKCIDECPSNVLKIKEVLEISKPELCISCGHCAAICPKNAIECSENNTRQPFKIINIDENLPLDQLLFHKKNSIRAFRNKIIENEFISKMIDYAEMAPSSHNLRNREYLVIKNSDDINKITEGIIKTYKNLLKVLNPLILWFISLTNKNAHQELLELTLSFRNLIEEHKKGNNKIFRGSKCIVCIAAPTGSTHSKDDCIAAQHYMMLFAKTLGLDSFIVGYAQFAHKVIEKHFKVKKGYSIFSVSAFGYAKNTYSNEVIYKKPTILWK